MAHAAQVWVQHFRDPLDVCDGVHRYDSCRMGRGMRALVEGEGVGCKLRSYLISVAYIYATCVRASPGAKPPRVIFRSRKHRECTSSVTHLHTATTGSHASMRQEGGGCRIEVLLLILVFNCGLGSDLGIGSEVGLGVGSMLGSRAFQGLH